MKNSIITLVFSVLVLLGIQTKAQTKFGVKVGLNANNFALDFKDSDDEFDTKMRLAYNFGATVDFGFSDTFGLRTGLEYTSKGFSMDLDKMFADELPDGATIDGYWRGIVNYLEIPIHARYQINDFQIYAGPYVAFGLGGKMVQDITATYEGETESESDEMTLKPFFGDVKEGDLDDDEDAFNAFDYGLNFGVGYQVGPIVMNAGYSLGLGNVTPSYENSEYDSKDDKISNRVISFSVSYFFGE